jgi:hypothetical protein
MSQVMGNTNPERAGTSRSLHTRQDDRTQARGFLTNPISKCQAETSRTPATVLFCLRIHPATHRTFSHSPSPAVTRTFRQNTRNQRVCKKRNRFKKSFPNSQNCNMQRNLPIVLRTASLIPIYAHRINASNSLDYKTALIPASPTTLS